MSCDFSPSAYPFTVDCPDSTVRCLGLSPWFDVSAIPDATAFFVFFNIFRIIGDGRVKFAARATNDQNNPGGFTVFGSYISTTGDDTQTHNISSLVSNKLFVQFAVAYDRETNPGQVEGIFFPRG